MHTGMRRTELLSIMFFSEGGGFPKLKGHRDCPYERFGAKTPNVIPHISQHLLNNDNGPGVILVRLESTVANGL